MAQDTQEYNYNPPMATVLIVLIVLFFTVGFISVYLRHFIVCLGIDLGRGPVTIGGWGTRRARRGLDPALLEAFPTFLYSDVKVHRMGKSSLECAICISEFADNEMLQLLPPCSHVFHPHCVGPWLESHVTCPVCRANLEAQSNNNDRCLSFDSFVVHNLEQTSDDESEPSNLQTRSNNNDDPNRDVIGRVGRSPESNKLMKSPTVQEMKGVGVRVGSLPRSHSTGHSLVEDCDDRYTLRLPEEVRNKLVNFNHLSGLPAAIVSPRIGYRARSVGCSGIPAIKPERWRFSVSPSFITRPGSPKCDGATGSGSGNNYNNHSSSTNSGGILSGPRNMFKSIKSPLNRVDRSTDIGERSSDKLWSKGSSHEYDLESQSK